MSHRIRNLFLATLLIFTVSVTTTYAESSDTVSHVENVSITSYSYDFESDFFIFGEKYYTVVKYTINNSNNEGKDILLSFKNYNNKTLETKRIFIGKNSAYTGKTNIWTGTFLYIIWGEEQEKIWMVIDYDDSIIVKK